jgi:hypothetical protein
MSDSTRHEHLDWCKARALEYLNRGDLSNAVASMASDMTKHPETSCPPALTMVGMMAVMNHDADGVRRWIAGFN